MTATRARRPTRRFWDTARLAVVILGWIVLIAALDAGLGALVDGTDPATPEEDRASRFLPAGDDPADVSGEADPGGADDAEWSDTYWAELAVTEQRGADLVPFLGWRLPDTDLTDINVADGVRESYQQDGLDDAAPTVWFFGGSTMWGEGQRDLHTIPSEVARLAEEDGVAVRVQNRGQRGWVFWQEILAFEQALATQDPPDVVVFYDGTNEIGVQRGGESGRQAGARPSDDPTVYTVGQAEGAYVPSPFSAVTPPATSETLFERWADASLVLNLFAIAPAAAQEATEIPDATLAARVLDIYERGRVIARHLAAEAAVEPVFFWQPDRGFTRRDAREMTVRAGLTPPTIDISDTFDGLELGEVYIDGAHTNEYGAELVADAIWTHLRPVIEGIPSR